MMMKQNQRMVQDEDKVRAEEAVNNYMASLAELTVNSKPHINALTFLAEDYLNYADAIVNAVDDHLEKVPSNVKLPILYLIDSIIKNVGKDYTTLFSRTLVQSFCTVFKQVDEKTRQNMYKLRQTWNEIYSQEYLYAMDVSVRALDPKWPITAAPPTVLAQASHKILINPKFLSTNSGIKPPPVASAIGRQATGVTNISPAIALKANSAVPETVLSTDVAPASDPEMLREQLLQSKRDLLLLQQEKVDLELSQMKAKLDKKSKHVSILNEKAALENPKKGSHDVPAAVPVKSEETNMATLLKEEEKKVVKQEMKKKIPISVPADSSHPLVPINTPRIAPVSSGLINLVTSQRAQRDPRLAKQQKEVVVDNASKPLGRNSEPRVITKPEKRSRSTEKELSSSKINRHHSRDDSSDRSSSRHSSRRDDRDKRSIENRKTSRKSENRSSCRSKKTSSRSPSKKRSISPPSKKTSGHSPSKKTGSCSPSKKTSSRSPSRVSSSRSPSTNTTKRERRGESKYSSRKSSSYAGHRPVSDCADSLESDESDSIERAVSPLSPRPATSSGSGGSDWAVNYTKGSHKGRNYIRKNNLPEESAETIGSSISSDVDLRVSAPPEKQPRLSTSSERLLQASSSAVSSGVPEQILPTIACQDVDLRCLPSSPGKKRRSAEPEEGPPPTKKNKTAFMESLFGNQDVDLRQMDMNNGVSGDAPSPPPPPIISSPDGRPMLKDDTLGWSKFKQALTPSPTVERSPAFPRSSRHDRLGRTAREEELSQNEDTDMRLSVNGLDSTSKTDFQAVLASATEQFRNGIISQAVFEEVQKQVFRMSESEKIREAQRNDFTRRDSWEKRPRREKDYRHGLGSPNSEQFGDIDERYPTPRPGKKTLLPLPSVPPVQLQEGVRHPYHYMGQRMSGPMQGSGYIRPHRPILGPGPRGHIRGSFPFPRVSRYRPSTISLPSADPNILDRIAQDPMRTITIDGFLRDIRIYGDTAVVLIGPDNPREISFEPGDASIIINGVVVPCSFHQPAKEINIGGKVYSVRLGVPTRELYVNDVGYECQFKCPPREIRVGRKFDSEVLLVQLQSEAEPKVTVGGERKDLVAGRVMLIIDAENFVPIFLDAKPQRFDIAGTPHIIKFVDALETILVNNHPFNIQFGGPPVPITVRDEDHYVRLTELPRGVVPGQVEIECMDNFRTKPVAPPAQSRVGPWLGPAGPSMGGRGATDPSQLEHEPALPVRGSVGVATRGMPKKIMKPKARREPSDSLKPAKTEGREMPAELLQAIQPGLPSLLGLLPGSNNSGYSSAAPAAYSMRQGGGTGTAASASETALPTSSTDASAVEPTASSSTGSNGIPFLAADLDINSLFQSLYSTGLISSLSSITDSKKDKDEEEVKKKTHEVNFKESSTMKVKQPALIDVLYSGIQCSSCGTRFPPEQTEKYSAHLDWHFRQNRRDKDSVRKPQSRKWYYDVTDWIQFEEIDDTVDKGQNWFETQQSETAKFDETEEEEVQSVPSKDFAEGTICQLCHDKFDQFYNEEKEEWHLKDCLVAESLPYHPVCYKDYRTSVESTEEAAEPDTAAEGPENVTSPSSDEDSAKKESDETIKEEDMDKKDMKMEPEAIEATEETTQDEEEPSSSPDADEVLIPVVKQEVTEEEKDACAAEKESEEVKPEVAIEEPIIKEEKDEEESEAIEESGAALANEDQVESKSLEDQLLHDPVTDTTSAIVSCSIDGNLELSQAPATLPSVPNRIKINISKPLVVKPSEETEDESDKASESEHEEQATNSEPVPPGEEPIVLKPKLVGRKLTELPPKTKGTETSGLCSIM